MGKKVKYPMEAFALAMVLFSTGMKEAALVGITVIFGDILLGVLNERANETNNRTMLNVCGCVITEVAMWLMFVAAGLKVDGAMVLRFTLIVILLFKHWKDNAEVKEFDYDGMLYADSLAYGAMLLVSLVLEYASTGKILKIALAKAGFVGPVWGQPMIALVLVGLVIAALNTIVSTESDDKAPLWVCLPIIVLNVPFILSNVLESDAMLFGMLVGMVVYLFCRKKVNQINLPKCMKGMPCEMVTLGIIYAVCALL